MLQGGGSAALQHCISRVATAVACSCLALGWKAQTVTVTAWGRLASTSRTQRLAHDAVMVCLHGPQSAHAGICSLVVATPSHKRSAVNCIMQYSTEN